MKKLISIDLDGTLLNKQSQISDFTKDVIKKIIDLGHVVILATGRPLSGAIDFYKELNLKTPLVTDNGGYINHPLDDSFPVRQSYIPKDVMHDLFNYAKNFVTSSFFCYNEVTYAYQYHPWIEDHFSGVYKDKIVHGDLTSFDLEPSGLIYFILRDKKNDFESYISKNLNEHLLYRSWGADQETAVYEVYLKSVSKSNAISYILDYYRIDKKNWISFGDAINDLEMVKDAELGIAMKNGDPLVIEVAKDVTILTNDEDGVAHYLIKHFNLRM